MKTFSIHVKWRKDNNHIFICDCKRLLDLKMPLEYGNFMKKIDFGIAAGDLKGEYKKAFSDFAKTGLLADLSVRSLTREDMPAAMDLMSRALSGRMTRTRRFLSDRHNNFPELFKGIFIGSELAGAVFGFPRNGYVLMSEIAVDRRFRGRGFGRHLATAFEKNAFSIHPRINAGSFDESAGFYSSLSYRPFLLAQFPGDAYTSADFRGYSVLRSSRTFAEIETEKADIRFIGKMRKKYQNASFQYIFTKVLDSS
ncbi:MAG: GNAT family N-acetyltransferase [Candidatus Aenigmarchaeota archaeon]|nr:GNAT family N-acetyltransferase [Candidatus Aenigmarchaeota archaeon]